ncbi:hypothetical protein HDU91_004379, partial [Kappamyces sp. JEL0680]
GLQKEHSLHPTPAALESKTHLSGSHSAVPAATEKLPEPKDLAAEEDFKQVLQGVLPMGYKELKQLSARVSDITTKLRMQFEYDSQETQTQENRFSEEQLSRKPSMLLSTDALFSPAGTQPNANAQGPDFKERVENAEYPGGESTLPKDVGDISKYYHYGLGSVKDIKQPVLKYWRKILRLPSVTRIIVDCFWYIWHLNWKPEDLDTPKVLLDRICRNYTELFFKVSGSTKDLFFMVCKLTLTAWKKYPDFLSHGICLLYEDCFPPSIEEFADNFKNKVCTTICELMWGIHPSVLPCIDWPKETEPVKLSKKEDQKLLKRKLLIQLLTSSKAIDIPIVLHEKTDEKDLRLIYDQEPESAYVGSVRKAAHVNFNLYQNSPLIGKYLQVVGTFDSKKVLIRRNEMRPAHRPADAKTYRQIIQESLKSTQERAAAFKETQDILNREKTKIIQDNVALLAKEAGKATKMLKTPQAIKKAADSIMESTRLPSIVN